jgi:hypothetical protein
MPRRNQAAAAGGPVSARPSAVADHERAEPRAPAAAAHDLLHLGRDLESPFPRVRTSR